MYIDRMLSDGLPQQISYYVLKGKIDLKRLVRGGLTLETVTGDASPNPGQKKKIIVGQILCTVYLELYLRCSNTV